MREQPDALDSFIPLKSPCPRGGSFSRPEIELKCRAQFLMEKSRPNSYWRKVEDDTDRNWKTIDKLLKSLALPRGIEPLFQP